MIFTEYPATDFRVNNTTASFFTRGDERLSFRMAIVPLDCHGKVKDIEVVLNKDIINPLKNKKLLEYSISGKSNLRIKWKG